MKVFRNYSAVELDAQYNNRAAVPGHPRILERWKQRSAAFRAEAGAAAHLDLAYGPGERERLDVFTAAAHGSPLHLFIHGGYWQALDKSSFSHVAESLVAGGVTTAIVGYPLCPDVSIAGIVASVRKACIWLRGHARELGADPGRLQISGHSAGGHLVAMALATDWSRLDAGLPAQIVHSGIAVSGLFDLEPLRHTYLNRVLGLDAESARAASPLQLEPVGRPELALATGARESDEYHRQAREFAHAWRRQGVDARLLDLPRHDHFSILDELTEPGGRLLAIAVELLGAGA